MFGFETRRCWLGPTLVQPVIKNKKLRDGPNLNSLRFQSFNVTNRGFEPTFNVPHMISDSIEQSMPGGRFFSRIQN